MSNKYITEVVFTGIKFRLLANRIIEMTKMAGRHVSQCDAVSLI